MNCANCGRPKDEHVSVEPADALLGSTIWICPRNVFVPESDGKQAVQAVADLVNQKAAEPR